MEPRGTGVNKNAYFVTSDLTSDWIELGDARPVHLKAAREIRYMFTGELETKIVTNPHFPGLEKDYLRCQIARIVQSTTIMPDGMFKPIGPDSPFGFEPIEDAKPLKTKELTLLKNWVHAVPHILQQGRITHKEIEVPQDVQDPDKYKADINSKDPPAEVLKPISEDDSLTSSYQKVKIPAWKIQFLYDDKIYTRTGITNPEKDNTANYTVICIRSLRWPGLYVIRYKGEIYHLYFGWGHKFIDTNLGERFVYEKFPKINSDPEEIKCCAEPVEKKEEVVADANPNNANPDS